VDKLKLIRVNDEDHPLTIDSDVFQGRATVRIQGFTGVRPSAEGGEGNDEDAAGLETHYFEHGHAKGCTWSVQVQGRFKKTVCVDDVEYGNQFERPIKDKLPWGTSVALRAINIIDPTLRHDIYSDQPWAFGPLITSMTRVNVHRLDKQADSSDTSTWPAFPKGTSDEDYVQDDTSALLRDPTDPTNIRKEIEDEGLADFSTLNQLSDKQSAHTNRARFWSNSSTRQAVSFEPTDIVSLAFDNAFIDFNTLRAVLPYTGGMGFDLQHYWDGQPVRYFCKDASTGTVFFVVE
jgi:hypothetical protein